MGFRFAGFGQGVRLREVATGTGAPAPSRRTLTRRGAVVQPPVARSYGYRSTAHQVPAGDSPASDQPLPLRGSQADEISVPASRAVIDADAFSPGRGFMGRTEDALNTGRPPNRINRNTNALAAGIIGVIGAPDGTSGWPYDGNALFIAHVNIPRTPITVTGFQRTIDTGAVIVASPIGGSIE